MKIDLTGICKFLLTLLMGAALLALMISFSSCTKDAAQPCMQAIQIKNGLFNGKVEKDTTFGRGCTQSIVNGKFVFDFTCYGFPMTMTMDSIQSKTSELTYLQYKGTVRISEMENIQGLWYFYMDNDLKNRTIPFYIGATFRWIKF